MFWRNAEYTIRLGHLSPSRLSWLFCNSSLHQCIFWMKSTLLLIFPTHRILVTSSEQGSKARNSLLYRWKKGCSQMQTYCSKPGSEMEPRSLSGQHNGLRQHYTTRILHKVTKVTRIDTRYHILRISQELRRPLHVLFPCHQIASVQL